MYFWLDHFMTYFLLRWMHWFLRVLWLVVVSDLSKHTKRQGKILLLLLLLLLSLLLFICVLVCRSQVCSG